MGEVTATHVGSGRGLSIRDHEEGFDALAALARALDASDEFTDVRLTVSRQEDVAWRRED